MNGFKFGTVVCIVMSGLLWGCSSGQQQDPDSVSGSDGAVQAEAGTVTVTFDFGDGQPTSVTVEGVRAGDTVLDCLLKIEQPPITVNGSGQNAFVSRIGEKGTDASEGWSYKVNDRWADRSVGVYEVEPNDIVLWSYGGFESGD